MNKLNEPYLDNFDLDMNLHHDNRSLNDLHRPLNSKISNLYSISFYPELNVFHIYNTKEIGKESVRLTFSDNGWVLQELIHNWIKVPGYSRKIYNTPEEALNILGGSLVYEIGNKIREFINKNKKRSYFKKDSDSGSVISSFRRRSKRRFSSNLKKRFSKKVGKHNKRHSKKRRKVRSRKKII